MLGDVKSKGMTAQEASKLKSETYSRAARNRRLKQRRTGQQKQQLRQPVVEVEEEEKEGGEVHLLTTPARRVGGPLKGVTEISVSTSSSTSPLNRLVSITP